MNLVSKTQFDHLRSWLTFNELHAARRVSKRWLAVHDVDKVVCIDSSNPIGPFANFDRVTSLQINEIKGFYNDMATIRNLLLKNQKYLKNLAMRFEYPSPTIPAMFLAGLPSFPKLEKLLFAAEDCEDEDMENVYNLMIRLCPNLKDLDATAIWDLTTFDFASLRELKKLGIRKNEDDYTIENAEVGKLQELIIYRLHYLKASLDLSHHGIWITSFPNLIVTFDCKFAIHDKLAIQKCILEKERLVVKKVRLQSDDFPAKDIALKVKEFMVNLRTLRPQCVKIVSDLANGEPESVKFALSLIIAKVKEVDIQEN